MGIPSVKEKKKKKQEENNVEQCKEQMIDLSNLLKSSTLHGKVFSVYIDYLISLLWQKI